MANEHVNLYALVEEQIDTIFDARRDLGSALVALYKLILQLKGLVEEHRNQKSDDRCWEDDNKLYAGFGLPPGDFRVGDPDAMLVNCRRFLENRCKGGGWPTYADLEQMIEDYKQRLVAKEAKYQSWLECILQLNQEAKTFDHQNLKQRINDLAVLANQFAVTPNNGMSAEQYAIYRSGILNERARVIKLLESKASSHPAGNTTEGRVVLRDTANEIKNTEGI